MKRSGFLRRRAATPKRSSLIARRRRRADRQEHNEETTGIYAQVDRRAQGRCECGCGLAFDASLDGRPQMDHMFGRIEEQTVEACWMLRADHYAAKTAHSPSRYHWINRFLVHVTRHRYDAEARRTGKELGAARAKELNRSRNRPAEGAG